MARVIYQEGFNTGGVTTAGVYEEDGEIISTEVMPSNVVENIIDSVHRDKVEGMPPPRAGFQPLARIPTTTYHNWRTEWRKTAKQDGVKWKLFLARKINSPEYALLRFQKA